MNNNIPTLLLQGGFLTGIAFLGRIYMKWILEQTENKKNRFLRYSAYFTVTVLNLTVCSVCVGVVVYLCKSLF